MNWITNFVKPTLKALIKRSDIPDGFWIKCSHCDHMIFHKILEDNLYVCDHCSHHLPIPVEKRFKHLFDDYTLIKLPEAPIDPLHFKDKVKYADRLVQYQKKTGRIDAAQAAFGKIQGKSCVIFCMDFSFIGGSMGVYVGSAFVKASSLAAKNNCPLIAITASGGARMQESILSLMQMSKTVAAVEILKSKKLPYICILTNPTLGGVSASFAMLGDITIAEPRAVIGFTGPRVIEQTIREKLPESFQTSEYLLKHGMIDSIVERKELKNYLSRLLKILQPAHIL